MSEPGTGRPSKPEKAHPKGRPTKPLRAEGIRGAQATAEAIYLARRGHDNDEIRSILESQFGYDLSARLDEIRPTYRFDETCQRTVPQALAAFFESTSYEDAIRNAISLGGDADTLACITGGIAEAYYGGVPRELETHTMALLDDHLVRVVERFRERFGLVSRGAGRAP